MSSYEAVPALMVHFRGNMNIVDIAGEVGTSLLNKQSLRGKLTR